MKNKIIIIALSVAVLVLLYWVLSDGKNHDTGARQHADVVADHDTLEAHGVDYRRIIDSLSIDNYRLDSANKSLREGQAITRRQLDLQTAKAKDLAAQVKALNKDTALTAKIDSLVSEINNLTFLLHQYEVFADSINKVNDSLKVNYEAQVKEKDKRIAELQVGYDKLFKAYQELFADKAELMKDLKRQKLKTKIAAVLGAAAAVLGLIK